jgi:DNA-binding transcriptional ArsR family regulator
MSRRPDPDHVPLTTAQLEQVAARFRALSAPSRLRVLNALMRGPLGMDALAAASGLQQSNLSRQVAELERAGCVARERDGRQVVVRIVDQTLRQLCALVCGSLQQQAAADEAVWRPRRAGTR